MIDHVASLGLKNLVIVSPDAACRARARVCQATGCFARHHRQAAGRGKRAEVMHVIGEVDGRTCLIVDDIVDTAGTLAAPCTLTRKGRKASTAASRTPCCRSGGHRIRASEMMQTW